MLEPDRIEFLPSFGIRVDRVGIVLVRDDQSKVLVARAFSSGLIKETIADDQSLLLLLLEYSNLVCPQMDREVIAFSRQDVKIYNA